MEVHEKIATIRNQKGISQYEMADHLNIGQSAYFQIEKGKTALTVTRLYEIAKILGVEVGELLGEEVKVEGNSEEVASLINRVAELESRIKDKETIIDFITENYNDLQYCIEVYLENEIADYAMTNRLGIVTIDLIGESGNKKVAAHFKDIPLHVKLNKNNIDSYFFERYLNYDLNSWDIKIDEKQREEAVKYIIENNFFVWELHSHQQLLNKEFQKEFQKIDYRLRKEYKQYRDLQEKLKSLK